MMFKQLMRAGIAIIAIIYSFPAFAATYAGYGDEPTPSSFLGQKEYSP